MTEPKYRATIVAIRRIIENILSTVVDTEVDLPDDSFHLRRQFDDTVVAGLLPKAVDGQTTVKQSANVAGDTLLYTIGPFSPQPPGFRLAWFNLKDHPIASLHTVLVEVRAQILNWAGVPKVDEATLGLARVALPDLTLLKCMKRKELCDRIRPLLREYQVVATKFPVPPLQSLTDPEITILHVLDTFISKNPDARPEAKDCINYRIMRDLSGHTPWTRESWTQALETFDLDTSWDQPAVILRTRGQEANRIVFSNRTTFSPFQSDYLDDCAQEYRDDEGRRTAIARAIVLDHSFAEYKLSESQVRKLLRTRISRLRDVVTGDDPNSVKKIVDGALEEEESDAEKVRNTESDSDGAGADTTAMEEEDSTGRTEEKS